VLFEQAIELEGKQSTVRSDAASECVHDDKTKLYDCSGLF